ncbi:MAG: retropepsin-like aspartic protease [Chitinophagales bacterium]
MSLIKIPLQFEGDLGEKNIYSLFDSGASFSCISEDAVKDLALTLKLYRPLEIATAATHQYLKITHRAVVDFYLNDIRLSDEFMVIPGLSEDVIIGANTLQKWRIKLDFEHDTVIVDPKVAKAILKKLECAA